MGLYGDFDLRRGDSDAAGKYAGTVQTVRVAKGQKTVTVVVRSIHVAMLQSDLFKLGFYIAPHGYRAKGTFDRDTEWAVREFQRMARDNEFVPQADSVDGPGWRRVPGGLDRDKPMKQVPAAKRYTGGVTGVVDDATRRAIFNWIDNWWRRPYKKMILTVEELTAMMHTLPEAKAAEYLPELNQAIADGDIDQNAQRLTSFIAQIAEESSFLTAMTELPSPFPSSKSKYKGRGAIQLTGLANYEAYSCYLSNVSVAALHAYESASPAARAKMKPVTLDPDLRNTPEQVADAPYRFDSARWFWSVNAACNPLADGLTGLSGSAELAQFDKITLRINGGLNGQMVRQDNYKRAKSLFTVE